MAERDADGFLVASEWLIDRVLTAATNVHRELGPALLESVYQAAMEIELKAMGLRVRTEVPIAVSYRGQDLGLGFRADIIVEDCLLLELKSVERLNEVFLAQTINYLRLLKLKRGFILNFGQKLMKDGIQRVSV